MKTNQETLALAAATGRVVDFTPGQWAAKRLVLTGRVLAAVPANAITGATAKEAVLKAREWAKRHFAAPAQTIIGEVQITSQSMKDTFTVKHGGVYQNKLDAVPTLKIILENGVYLGAAADIDGTLRENHYFGGKIKIGDAEQLVFIRTRQAEGRPNTFYVHQVFTENAIRKPAVLKPVAEYAKGDSGNPGGTAGFKNATEIYATIIGRLFADAHNITPDYDLSNSNPATAAQSTNCDQYDPMQDAAISAAIDEACGKFADDEPLPGPPGRDESRGGCADDCPKPGNEGEP